MKNVIIAFLALALLPACSLPNGSVGGKKSPTKAGNSYEISVNNVKSSLSDSPSVEYIPGSGYLMRSQKKPSGDTQYALAILFLDKDGDGEIEGAQIEVTGTMGPEDFVQWRGEYGGEDVKFSKNGNKVSGSIYARDIKPSRSYSWNLVDLSLNLKFNTTIK